MSDAPEGQQLLPLAEATLADRSDAQVVSLDAPAWAASADGSTLASLVYTRDPGRPADDVTVVVRDARTGNERSRFQAPMDVVGPVLNRDGTLLVAVSRDEPTEWWALETATGAVRGHVELSGSGWHTYTIDPEAHRLYLLESDLPIEPLPNQPRSVALSVRDLGTGGEIARVDLPDVLAGPWLSARLIDGAQTPAFLSPAMAFTPDGRRLAIVHADADLATLIDTEHVRVERAVPLVSRGHGPMALLDLLGLAPRVAQAKGFDGATRQAVFAPDGQRLYIWGLDGEFAGDGRPTYHGRGLEVVDATRGMVISSALPNRRVDTVLPAPDGTSVYVLGPAEDNNVDMGRSAYLLRRLDTADLTLQAERVFRGSRRLALIAGASGPSEQASSE